MGTYNAVFIVFFLLASAAAQQTSPTLFTVEGTVINSATGRPVPRALVHLSDRAMLTGGEGENIIDHNGVILFVTFTRDVAEVRSAGGVRHFEQRMIGS